MALRNLFEAHPANKENENKLKLQHIRLRYIDAVEIEPEKNIFDFLHDKMKISASLPKKLLADQRLNGKAIDFSWQTSFFTNDPDGLITLNFAIGVHKNKPALIWNTLLQTSQGNFSSIPDDFSEWLEKAHSLIHDWFFCLIEGDLERRFSGE